MNCYSSIVQPNLRYDRIVSFAFAEPTWLNLQCTWLHLSTLFVHSTTSTNLHKLSLEIFRLIWKKQSCCYIFKSGFFFSLLDLKEAIVFLYFKNQVDVWIIWTVGIVMLQLSAFHHVSTAGFCKAIWLIYCLLPGLISTFSCFLQLLTFELLKDSMTYKDVRLL